MGNWPLPKYPKTVESGPFGKFRLHNKHEEEIYDLFCIIDAEENKKGAQLDADTLRRLLQGSLNPRIFLHREVYKFLDFYRLVEEFLVARGMECSYACGHEHRIPRIIADIWTGEYYEIERDMAMERFHKLRTTSFYGTSSDLSAGIPSKEADHPVPYIHPSTSSVSSSGIACQHEDRMEPSLTNTSPCTAVKRIAKIRPVESRSRILHCGKRILFFRCKKTHDYKKVHRRLLKRKKSTMKKRPPRKGRQFRLPNILHRSPIRHKILKRTCRTMKKRPPRESGRLRGSCKLYLSAFQTLLPKLFRPYRSGLLQKHSPRNTIH